MRLGLQWKARNKALAFVRWREDLEREARPEGERPTFFINNSKKGNLLKIKYETLNF